MPKLHCLFHPGTDSIGIGAMQLGGIAPGSNHDPLAAAATTCRTTGFDIATSGNIKPICPNGFLFPVFARLLFKEDVPACTLGTPDTNITRATGAVF